MTCWDKVFDFVLRMEGGYSDHPSDRGDKINMGITSSCNVLRHVLQKQRKKKESLRYNGIRLKNQPYRGGPHEHYNRRNAIPPAFM